MWKPAVLWLGGFSAVLILAAVAVAAIMIVARARCQASPFIIYHISYQPSWQRFDPHDSSPFVPRDPPHYSLSSATHSR